MDHLFLSLLLILFFTSLASAQQNYSASSAFDCNTSEDTGPSSALLYTCNGHTTSCEAFLIFKSQPFYNSVPTISSITSTNKEELAKLNQVTPQSEFPLNKEVIVPVNCSCLGQYYQANSTYRVSNDYRTYYVIATRMYKGLSTCADIKRANTHSEFNLSLDQELQVPLRCACPTLNQIRNGTNFLLTYPVNSGDSISDIADRFNVSLEIILDANGLGENSVIYTETTILIPLATKPTSLNTVVHNEPPSMLPSLPYSPESKRSKRKLYERVGIAVACLFLLAIVLAILFLFHRESRKRVPESGAEVKQGFPGDLRVEIASVEYTLKVFGIKEVKKATEDFSSKHRIKGSVYWGEFNGDILAVKKTSRDVSKEVNILKRFNHFNLIKLHGVCENLGCFYLIFEYMKNGSLREWLSRREETGSWKKKIQIALDVANGLYYLHSFTDPPCVHKDIDSSNILLDRNLRAKVANFALARATARGTTNIATTMHVEGTRGYMAPEYLQTGKVSPKMDVYAFGVVLLELITGKDAVFIQDGSEVLLSAAIISIAQKENAETDLLFFIDPALCRSHEKTLALRLARVSMACLTREPARRLAMEEVVSLLLKIQAASEKSDSLDVKSADVAAPLWHSSIGETNFER
ncbi:lysM domain receptor-like kinase 4 [Euphorbia lathyris]|uniref:lysM domain receptor-like kinase 4 n=1 Tax=Euphorbia lathyris TaxID=212925 RepID=UPI0033139CE6